MYTHITRGNYDGHCTRTSSGGNYDGDWRFFYKHYIFRKGCPFLDAILWMCRFRSWGSDIRWTFIQKQVIVWVIEKIYESILHILLPKWMLFLPTQSNIRKVTTVYKLLFLNEINISREHISKHAPCFSPFMYVMHVIPAKRFFWYPDAYICNHVSVLNVFSRHNELFAANNIFIFSVTFSCLYGSIYEDFGVRSRCLS